MQGKGRSKRKGKSDKKHSRKVGGKRCEKIEGKGRRRKQVRKGVGNVT
jgi:hypothetical protein